jgi:hypothetical protein
VLQRGQADKPARISDGMHMLRDGGAFSFIQSGLDMGYGGIIFNFAPRLYQLPTFEAPHLERSDLLVSVTRPSLNDDPENDLRLLGHSNTAFEVNIFNALRTFFFKYVNRDAVVLLENLALPEETACYRGARFALRGGGARVTQIGDITEPAQFCERRENFIDPFTIAYTCYLPRISKDIPCAFLLAFGLNGTSTQNWAFLLSTKYHSLLKDIVRSQSPRIVLSIISETTNDFVPMALSDLKLTGNVVADITVSQEEI